MNTKLTLKLNQSVIEKAKDYASKQNLSLSKIVERYLQSISSEDKSDDFEISPYVKSMATGVNVPTDIDYKEGYGDYLLQKHK